MRFSCAVYVAVAVDFLVSFVGLGHFIWLWLIFTNRRFKFCFFSHLLSLKMKQNIITSRASQPASLMPNIFISQPKVMAIAIVLSRATQRNTTSDEHATPQNASAFLMSILNKLGKFLDGFAVCVSVRARFFFFRFLLTSNKCSPMDGFTCTNYNRQPIPLQSSSGLVQFVCKDSRHGDGEMARKQASKNAMRNSAKCIASDK